MEDQEVCATKCAPSCATYKGCRVDASAAVSWSVVVASADEGQLSLRAVIILLAPRALRFQLAGLGLLARALFRLGGHQPAA